MREGGWKSDNAYHKINTGQVYVLDFYFILKLFTIFELQVVNISHHFYLNFRFVLWQKEGCKDCLT